MSIPSTGDYGVEEGIVSSFPCETRNGEYTVVQGLEVGDFSQGKIDATVAELKEERDAVAELGLV
jgi:malate dehydrogenase